RRLANFGFALVLVQRKNLKEDHFHTVFWFNLFLFGIVTAILFLSAPAIADFFENPLLADILMVISFDFILKALSAVPTAKLTRNMKFKEIGKIATVNSVVILIPIAFTLMGYGVWSLVYGVLLGSFVSDLMGFYYARWYPRLRFKYWVLRDVFNFGIWVNISSYLNYFISNTDYFFIGKFLNAAQLGYYERAFNLMNLPKKRVRQIVKNVLFSAYSKMKYEMGRLRAAFLKVTTHISVILFPLMVWLFFAAPSLIIVLYGGKWEPTIYPLQVMCISGLIYTFSSMFSPVFMAKGMVSTEALSKFLHLIALAGAVIFTIQWGINGVAWGVAFASFISLIVNLILMKWKMKLSVQKYFLAQRSAMVYSLFQIIILIGFQYAVKSYISKDSWQMLLAVTILSLISYLSAHLIIRFKDLSEIFDEYFYDLKKMLRQVPVIKNLGFLTPKP
ncbi:MAG: lipopolysaccharide biosynthesis protein, partial [Calditrichia bacterium]